MQRKILIVFTLVFCVVIQDLFGQTTFQKTYTTIGGAYCIAGYQTSDGNYLLAGYSVDQGLEGIYLIKMDVFGDTVWTKKYDTPGILNAPTAIDESVDGNLFITGLTFLNGNKFDVFLMYVDASGNLFWIKNFNNTSAIGGSDDYSKGIVATPDSGCIIVGTTQGTIAFAGGEAYVLKISKNGDIMWNNSYQHSYAIEGKYIVPTYDGGYIICGRRESLGTAAGKIYLLKINNSGAVEWSKLINGQAPSWGEADFVKQTSDNGYIVAGKDDADKIVYLLKTDSTGNFTWMKAYDTPESKYLFSFEITSDSGFALAGREDLLGGSNYFLIRTNATGDTLFTKQYAISGSDAAYYLNQTTDNGFIMAGCANHSIYVVRTDSIGNTGCNMSSFPFTVRDTMGNDFDANVTQVVLNWSTAIPSISLSGGGTITTLCSTVGVSELPENQTFVISPNPTSGNFSITFNKYINNGFVEVYDVLGNIILTRKINDEINLEMRLQNILNGIYLVKAFDGNKSYCKKLIIQ